MASTSQGHAKKPRLSLQIKTSCDSPPRQARTHNVNPGDPTTFNTLSNAYVSAIERSTPLTAINTLQAFSLASPVESRDPKHRTSTPYVANYPETPLSATASSPRPPPSASFPGNMAMTSTPPLSGSRDPTTEPGAFSFSSKDTGESTSNSREATKQQQRPAPLSQSPRRRGNPQSLPPYTHPRVLRSILRNSPLPPRTAIPPPSPRRQSLRLQEKAARRVGYNSPIEQEIITNKYTKSHIDLLSEDLSPNTPPSGGPRNSDDILDLALAFTPNEIRDGGQTPGPFEETRRRMASSTPGSLPASPAGVTGVRKRKKREKKRRWVWTLDQHDEDEEEDEDQVGGAVAALRAEAERKKSAQGENMMVDYAALPGPQAAEVPTPSVESCDSAWSESRDVDMTDASSVTSEDALGVPSHTENEVDLKTPTAPHPPGTVVKRDTPIPELATDSQRSTPVPPVHGEAEASGRRA